MLFSEIYLSCLFAQLLQTVPTCSLDLVNVTNIFKVVVTFCDFICETRSCNWKLSRKKGSRQAAGTAKLIKKLGESILLLFLYLSAEGFVCDLQP